MIQLPKMKKSDILMWGFIAGLLLCAGLLFIADGLGYMQ